MTYTTTDQMPSCDDGCLGYIRNSSMYKSETIESTVEFTPNVEDAIE